MRHELCAMAMLRWLVSTILLWSGIPLLAMDGIRFVSVDESYYKRNLKRETQAAILSKVRMNNRNLLTFCHVCNSRCTSICPGQG